jgi:RimJ/RimL family protein N-acetyltransferase
VRPLCAGLDQHLIIEALLAGMSPGCVFVDDIHAPGAALLRSAEGTFLVGNSSNSAFTSAVRRFVHDTVLAPGGEDELVFYYADARWEAPIASILRPRRPIVRSRVHYALTPAATPRVDAVDGFDLCLLDAEWFAVRQYQQRNVAGVLGWVQGNWGGPEAFLARGFGACLLRDDSIVSYSLADCVGAGRCEIGVMTDAAWRRRRLGSTVVAASIAQARARGITRVGWHCWSDNQASRRLAEQHGFELTHEYAARYALSDSDQHARGLAWVANHAAAPRSGVTTGRTVTR